MRTVKTAESLIDVALGRFSGSQPDDIFCICGRLALGERGELEAKDVLSLSRYQTCEIMITLFLFDFSVVVWDAGCLKWFD